MYPSIYANVYKIVYEHFIVLKRGCAIPFPAITFYHFKTIFFNGHEKCNQG